MEEEVGLNAQDLPRELSSLEKQLQTLTSFLKDADSKVERCVSAEAWVRRVRNLAFRIEDVIDEYLVQTQTRSESQIQGNISDQMARSIAEIEEEVDELERGKAVCDLRDQDPAGKWEDPRAGFLYDRDPDLTGLDRPEEEMVELLNLEGGLVVGMVGMGGIGKTTLGKKVFENTKVRRNFSVLAWVNASQRNGSWENLLRGMLQDFYKSAAMPPPQLGGMDETSLIEESRTFLEDKRYLVVFDDVWHPGLWHNIKNALPDNGKGSKIILTTRQEDVALTWGSSPAAADNHIYHLKLLPPDKAWELFCKKAFQGRPCPSVLEEIAHNIVDKCEGLPLALVSIGSLLSTKEESFTVWRDFRNTLSRELDRHPELMSISRLLLLSYDDLSSYLKPCLLYFAMFPCGSSIECNRLLKLWMAEDFIKRERGEAIEIEDVAKNRLLKLVQRSLVQVSTRYDCGRARTFRVHDLIYEVLRTKLEELNFCQILDKENPEAEVDTQTRRLSISTSLPNASRRIIDKCGIRSILLFGAHETPVPPLPGSLIKKVYLLKVLDLQSAPLDQIPNEIGDLLLLQYLSLRYTKVKTIPKTIGKLHNLLTLDLKRCPIFDLPVEIGNLRKLRHFVVYQNTWHNTLKVWVIGAVTIPERAMGNLLNLQKLADVNVAESIGFMDQLSTFKKLRYLAISNVKKEDSLALCKAIESLIYLGSLNVVVDHENVDPIDLQHVVSPPMTLQRVYLTGPLTKFPEWIGKLEGLNKLRFKGSKLKEIPFQVLGSLPNLTMLGINKDVYYGERLVFQAGGFRKLKALYFNMLLNLSSVEIQRGALPVLEDLLIQRSPKLKEAPLGLNYLEKLTSLKLVEMPQEIVDSLRHMTKQIADIRVGYQTPTGVYIYEKL